MKSFQGLLRVAVILLILTTGSYAIFQSVRINKLQTSDKNNEIEQVRTGVYGPNNTSFSIYTYDNGAHWYAIRKVQDKWHVVNTAEKEYPGLLESIYTLERAELELNKEKL